MVHDTLQGEWGMFYLRWGWFSWNMGNFLWGMGCFSGGMGVLRVMGCPTRTIWWVHRGMEYFSRNWWGSFHGTWGIFHGTWGLHVECGDFHGEWGVYQGESGHLLGAGGPRDIKNQGSVGNFSRKGDYSTGATSNAIVNWLLICVNTANRLLGPISGHEITLPSFFFACH